MSNPTSNFGWQMPTATDLVTDLPADFEVFGQAVDTSLADLKGGTTGQILAKNTNTDMDFVWTTPNPGDITAVNVTSPITGGGTSGDVTIGISSSAIVPSQTGNSGKYLTTDGTTSSWGTIAAGSMTLLSTTTLSGSSTTISSISGSYQTLFVHLQSFQPSANASLDLRINSDSGSNYFSNGSFGGNSTSSTGTTYRWALDCATDRQTWNNQFIQLNNYANTSNRKFILSYGAHANQNAGFAGFNYYTGMWANTGAINSLTFLPAGGATWTGGTVYIYGVK